MASAQRAATTQDLGSAHELAELPALLLSVPEACKALSIGRSTLYQLFARGHLVAIKVGSSTRVPRRSLEGYVERKIAEAHAFRLSHPGRWS